MVSRTKVQFWTWVRTWTLLNWNKSSVLLVWKEPNWTECSVQRSTISGNFWTGSNRFKPVQTCVLLHFKIQKTHDNWHWPKRTSCELGRHHLRFPGIFPCFPSSPDHGEFFSWLQPAVDIMLLKFYHSSSPFLCICLLCRFVSPSTPTTPLRHFFIFAYFVDLFLLACLLPVKYV